MDRSLDDVISDRQVLKEAELEEEEVVVETTGRVMAQESDWLHDKYQDDDTETRRPFRAPRNRRDLDRYSPESELQTQDAKLRVDNLHYELTEEDLDDLFNRIGPVKSLALRYDRAGRSSGTAFVTYTTLSSAHAAIREFDGANAHGQPIRLSLLPTVHAASTGRRNGDSRNLFDRTAKPVRSLFDRIEKPISRERDRSRSPGAPRRTDTRKPPPDGIDRYVPGEDRNKRSRSRSPVRRGRGRRDDNGRGVRRGDRDGGRTTVNGRPRLTQQELDQEMEDYWGSKEVAAAKGGVTQTTNATLAANGTVVAGPPPAVDAGDVDMIDEEL
ncbi:hypothetical protein MMC14_002586 [Varicellaria rhodocarpa]|nr:hypothetical protein [Varicellaria rhodocarpa]